MPRKRSGVRGYPLFQPRSSGIGFHGSGSRTNAAEIADNPLPPIASLAWKRSGVRFPSGPPNTQFEGPPGPFIFEPLLALVHAMPDFKRVAASGALPSLEVIAG